MKKILSLFLVILLTTSLFAQSADFFDDAALFGGSFYDDDALFGGSGDFFDDDALFGGSSFADDPMFSDDDMFSDDGIIVIEDTTAKSALSTGTIFENGSIKIGGTISASVGSDLVIYDGKNKIQDTFKDNLKNTTFSPTLNGTLSIDARPTDNLRLYSKFGFDFPFKTSVTTVIPQTDIEEEYKNPFLPTDGKKQVLPQTQAQSTISEWLSVKEMFTDFNTNDVAFFRFGLHTVSWGTGYFYSPVSDIINTSSIDPENPTETVNGSLNLRTQVIFPGTQNCLWLYMIPDLATNKLIDTAVATKFDFVIGGVELGFGGRYKYNSPLIGTFTATGSLKSVSFFGEAVLRYGADSEWLKNPKFEDKTIIPQATLGFMKMWKDPSIMIAGQYYFNGYDTKVDFSNMMNLAYLSSDVANLIVNKGHNIALMANFSKLFGNENFNLATFGMLNIGKKELKDLVPAMFLTAMDGNAITVPEAIASLSLSYTGIDNVSISTGPYFTWNDIKKAPKIDYKLSVSLGGGKF